MRVVGARGMVIVWESFLMILVGGLALWSCCLTYAHAKEYFLQSSDKEILDFLLHTSRYDRRIRPPTGDGPLIVNVSVLLLSLSSPDESSLKYEVEFLLHQHWVDPRLKHDDAERHPYLSGMHHLDDVWLPDTFFIKTGTFKEPLEPDDIALKIYRNGTVHYTRRRHLILSCQGDLNIFPFDDPFCTFSMESISYEKQDLHFYWRNDTASDHGSSLTKSKNLQALNAYLIYNKTVICDDTFAWRGNYSCVKVDLMFTRDDAFYFSTVFFPGIILVTSSFITFWLEWNAVPARVMIGVTTMLNFFTTSNSFRATLPVVSNLSAMNTWDSVCMGFIYVSLLEFVVVNYVGRKRPKHNMVYMPGENAVTQRIPQAIHRIGLSLVSGWTERKRSPAGTGGHVGMTGVIGANTHLGDDIQTNRNSHEMVSCANCGNQQCTHANAPNNCPNGERNDGDAESECCPCNYYCCPTGACPGVSRRTSSASNDKPCPLAHLSEEWEVGSDTDAEEFSTDVAGSSSDMGGTHNKSYKPNKKDPPHPIRVAKSIDVISRIVFPLGFTIFLFYFFSRYKGWEMHH